jgi:hypothetical protein
MYAEINKPSLFMIPVVIKDIISYRFAGIPNIEASELSEIARKIIKENAKDVFIAGKTHFTYMWITDMAVAFKGIKKVLPHLYLQKQLHRIIDDSYKLGYVPTCFSKKQNFNMPFRRQDNFPSLIHCLYYLNNDSKSKENSDLKEGQEIYEKEKINSLYERYMQNYYDFDNNLLRQDAVHDWMDTIKRPSSTFSNLFLLNMLKKYEELFKEKTPHKECEKALIEKRWNGKYFIDYDNCGSYLCTDANVPALYFNLFSKDIQNKICDCIESSNMLYPLPMKTRQGEYDCTFISTLWSKNYHSVIWPHLGLMYLNGLKRLHRPYKEHLKRFEKNATEYKNFLEVIDMQGKPFSTPFFVTEHSFSMAAGQYLELLN